MNTLAILALLGAAMILADFLATRRQPAPASPTWIVNEVAAGILYFLARPDGPWVFVTYLGLLVLAITITVNTVRRIGHRHRTSQS